MPEDEAKQRREHLQELREKFLTSRKHRLMGKPYQKPNAKKQASSAKPTTSMSKDPKGVAVARGPGVATVGPSSSAAAVAEDNRLIQSIRPSLAGLNPSLLMPHVAGMSALPFGPLGSVLGQVTSPLVSEEIRQRILMNRALASLGGPFFNPALLDQRSLLLNQVYGPRYVTNQDSAALSHQLLAQIRGDDETSALLQNISGVASAAARPGLGVAGDQEEKSDLANQLRASMKRPGPPSGERTEPLKKRARDP